jgi:hypothetical protein
MERDTPVLVPATRTNPPSIKYNALKPQAVRGGIKKRVKKTGTSMICRLNMMTKAEHSRRETQCGDVVMKKGTEGRMLRTIQCR